MAFHVLFSVFITQSLIETFTNPNYAGSSIMGTLIAFSLAVILYLLVYSASYTSPDKVFYLMMAPSILAFTITPIISSFWEKIYYQFYEVGNNFLYIPSLQEVEIKEDEMKNNTEDE